VNEAVERLVAEAEIRRLIYTYSRAADRLDRELLRTIFHEDARIELGAIHRGGVEPFLDVAIGFMGSMAATRHDVGNILIVHHDASHASAESYVQAWHRIETPEGTRELTVYGRYLTRFGRRDGRWAIAWHSEIIDWGRMVPADAGWFDGNAEMEKGRRDATDGSYRALSAG